MRCERKGCIYEATSKVMLNRMILLNVCKECAKEIDYFLDIGIDKRIRKVF